MGRVAGPDHHPPLSGEGPLRPCKVGYAGNESGNATSTRHQLGTWR